MEIEFLCDVELTLVTNLGQDDEPIEDVRVFQKGSTLNITLIDHPSRFDGKDLVEDQTMWNVQLDDGAMVFGVTREWFKII